MPDDEEIKLYLYKIVELFILLNTISYSLLFPELFNKPIER